MNEKLNKMSIDQIIEMCDKYDVISFDIFDTLLFRPFYNPNDLFRVLSAKYNSMDFYNSRINAQKKARTEKKELSGNYEVKIDEIYSILEEEIGLDKKKGIKNEIDTEKKFIYPNPFLHNIYTKLLKKHKKIILVSDMYLTSDTIKDLLEKCGYTQYERLYVSCEYEMTKKYGDLFEKVKEDYKFKKILHIGDNKVSDYEQPINHGIDSILYQTPHSIEKKQLTMATTISSLYNGILYNKKYNGLENEQFNNPYYRYGYEYCGLFALGYANFIHEYAKKNNLDKIIFLSRDGYVYKKIYDKYFDDIPSEYSLWSRHANLKTATKEYFPRYLWQFVDRNTKNRKEYLVRNVIQDLKIEFMYPILKKVGITENSNLVNKSIKNVFLTALKDNKDLIFKQSDFYSENAKEYYKKIVGNSKKIGIVDIGYRASGAISLMNLFKKWNIDCESKAIVAFGTIDRNSFDDTLNLNGTVTSYVFSNVLNKTIGLSKDANKLLLEESIIDILLASAPKPSFYYFDRDNDNKIIPVYEKENTDAYPYIEQLYKGIFDFADDYFKKIGNEKYLLNIPGYDAYQPIYDLIHNNINQFANDYKDYPYDYMINSETKEIKTFGKIYNEYLNNTKYLFLKKVKRKLKKVLKKIKR